MPDRARLWDVFLTHRHCMAHHKLSRSSSRRSKLQILAQHFASDPLPLDVPKGCLAVYVGKDRQRFVIPITYLSHPLFASLLRLSEEEFDFHHEGGLTLPCDVDRFEDVILRISSCHGDPCASHHNNRVSSKSTVLEVH
ncbi:hypothetical protein O6H91_08G035100 [Diphasiastrum complanatum]|uniref:Uncharacterized protein n=1 Tax=Diphasiastrum complanatum TaxID=34168 RepID=A0ACC2CWG3_DIPCM|nr:hypothetical protein O6H91_Y194800 [Diphasiastrum complanatum]KAJ7546310.1 hypothetical protein O6H91_08G035100 [Diphasiastrum complanatum]